MREALPAVIAINAAKAAQRDLTVLYGLSSESVDEVFEGKRRKGGAANKMGEDFERYQSKTGGHSACGTPTHGGWQDCCRAWVVGML